MKLVFFLLFNPCFCPFAHMFVIFFSPIRLEAETNMAASSSVCGIGFEEMKLKNIYSYDVNNRAKNDANVSKRRKEKKKNTRKKTTNKLKQ